MSPKRMGKLLLVEAQAAYAYFAAWQMLSLRWRGTGRKPIPPDWRYVVARGSWVERPQPQRHPPPMNAMLNYAYAVLESQVRIATVSPRAWTRLSATCTPADPGV